MWLEKGLAEAYFSLDENYGNTIFTREEVASTLKKPLNDADQIIHRLRKNSALERVEWGKYKIVSPEKWIGIAKTVHEFPQMETVLREIFSRVSPEKIDSLILYGSVARGESTKYSDIDMMIVVKLKDRGRIEKSLKNLPGKINIQLYSWKGIKGTAEVDPLFVVFTEAEAEIIFDVETDYKRAVSLAASNIVKNPKKVFGAHLRDINGVVNSAKKLLEKKKYTQLIAYFLVMAARNLFMIRQAVNDKINPYDIGSGLRELFGGSYSELYRAYTFEKENKNAVKPGRKMLSEAFIKVNELLRQIRTEVKEHEKKKAASKGG